MLDKSTPPGGTDTATLEFVYRPEPTIERTELGDGGFRLDAGWRVVRHRIVKKTATRVYVEVDPYVDNGSASPVGSNAKQQTFFLDRFALEENGEVFRRGNYDGPSYFYATAELAAESTQSVSFMNLSAEWDPHSKTTKILKRGSAHPAFETLGIKPTATVDEVKAAFRRLSREAHPDAGGNADDFIKLREAYERALALA
jgi:hypothetical protein